MRSQGEEGLCPSSGAPVGRVVSRVLCPPGLALCPEVQDLLEGGDLPDLPSSLLLPEDTALRNLPPLRAAHRRFNFDTDRPLLSALEEVRLAFLTPHALLLHPAAKHVALLSRQGERPRAGLGWVGWAGRASFWKARSSLSFWAGCWSMGALHRTGPPPLCPPVGESGEGTGWAGRRATDGFVCLFS